MMSVNMGSDGYTNIGKSSDTRTIYVSSSHGNDSNSGTSEGSAVRTLKRAASLVRNDMPDHMLLKSGDSWTERLTWGKSGRNSQEPIVIGSYGDGARPMIKAGSGTALDVNADDVDHLAVVGIHFSAHTRDPNASGFSRTTGGYGIRFVAGTDGVLIEDCVIDQFTNNMNFQGYGGPQNNVKVRRSVITDAYGLEGKSQGMYATKVNGLTLEENIFDHNGWNGQVSGGGASALSHNAYIAADCSNVVVKGNIFADAASHGLQARAGGDIRDNLFLRNPIHLSFGLVNGSAQKPGGVSGAVDGNVFLDTRTINGAGRGWALELGNIKGATVRNNIISEDNDDDGSPAIRLLYGNNLSNTSSGVGINNLVIESNVVHKWTQSMSLDDALRPGGSGHTSLNNLTVRNNEFQIVNREFHKLVSHWMPVNRGEESWSNNRYYEDAAQGSWFGVGSSRTSLGEWRSKLEPNAQATQVRYNDPDRNVSRYASSVGVGSSMESFISAVRRRGTGSWSSNLSARNVINYVRGGFGRGGTSYSGGTGGPITSAPVNPSTPATPSTGNSPRIVGRTASRTSVRIKFSENVRASLTAKDLTLKNLNTGNTIAQSLRLSYNSRTNEATWTWPAFNGGKLRSARWQATLPDERVADTAGHHLAGGRDYSFTFNV